MPFQISTDFIGPLPTGTVWHINVATDAEGANSIVKFDVPFTVTPDAIYMQDPITINDVDQLFWLAEGATVHILAELIEPNSTVASSGSQTGVWSNTAGLSALIGQVLTTSSTGFNSSDRTTLDAISTDLTTIGSETSNINNQMSVPVTRNGVTLPVSLKDLLAQHTLDVLTLSEISTGPTGGPVTADISNQWIFGVIVRLTSIPSTLTPLTPDGGWYYPDLAVLRLFRGTDIRLRRGIHTTNWMESPLPGYAISAITDITLGTNPPWSSVEVDFMLGCEGQVYLMRLP